MFPQKYLEGLDLACLDDVMLLRFRDLGLAEKNNPRVSIPNYDIFVTIIWYAIRKKHYLSNPKKESSAYAMDWIELNDS